MEAARSLPFSTVRAKGDEVVIDGLRVHDATLARMVHERADAYDNPDKLVRDALEIGARVLDREQTAAHADFVKAEYERTSRELDIAFVERAGKVAERLDARVTEAFAVEDGQLAKVLARHFGEESSSAVQHQIRAMLTESLARSREDLVKQFSSADGSNPLADFKDMARRTMHQAAQRQAEQLDAMTQKLEGMNAELVRLHAERAAQDQVAAEVERGTAKGRTYEESVADAIDAIAAGRGDDAEAVGDTRGEGGRTGDVLVGLGGATGAARGRIVFEAKNSRLSRNKAVEELDRALQTRAADYAILVVPSAEHLPARCEPLRELGGNKSFTIYDPDDGPITLELAYRLAAARVLMARGEAGTLDPEAIQAEVERAQGAMTLVQSIKQQLTNSNTAVEKARDFLESMAGQVRGHLAQIEALIAEAQAAADDAAGDADAA